VRKYLLSAEIYCLSILFWLTVASKVSPILLIYKYIILIVELSTNCKKIAICSKTNLKQILSLLTLYTQLS